MVVKYLHYNTNTSHRFEIDVICWAQVVIFLKQHLMRFSYAFFSFEYIILYYLLCGTRRMFSKIKTNG